jgi:hypothetical protein
MPVATFPGSLPGAMDGLLTAPGAAPGPGPVPITVAAPAVGAGWEIRVLSWKDFSTRLALLPSKMIQSFQFVKQLSDIGSGSVTLNMDDAWWTLATLTGGLPAADILSYECVWEFAHDGAVRFQFLGETVQEQLVDPSGQRLVTITGPGTIAALKWAMAAPAGFPDIINKLDAIADSFDEVNVTGAGVLDTNIWTVASPSSAVYITPVTGLYNYPGGAGYALTGLYPSGTLSLAATTGPTVLGATPYDATETLISAQVSPVGAANIPTDSNGNPEAYGSNLNGSELTQFYIQSLANPSYFAMIGLSGSSFYCEESGPDGIKTKIIATAANFDTSNDAYWMITEQGGSAGGSGTFYFWTSADAQNWTLQWQVVHTWNATNCGFYVAASYSVAGQSAILSDINSNVTTPSYQGSTYLGLPGMGIWWDLLQLAQQRGTIPFVTTSLSQSADSFGRPWTDSQNVQVTNGTDLYTLLQGFAGVVNADFVMQPGFVLQVGQPERNAVSIGVDRTAGIVLREAQDQTSAQRTRARNQIVNLVGGENSDGSEMSAANSASVTQWGQREGWFQAGAQIDPVSMEIAVAAAAAANASEVLSYTLTILPNLPGRTVFSNFDVGDWVGLEDPPPFTSIEAVRVVGIAVEVDSTGLETNELTIQSYVQWLEQQLTYISNLLGGSFVNTAGTTPVAPSKYGTGQVPTYFTPAQSLGSLSNVIGTAPANGAPLVYNSSTGKWQPAGTTNPATGSSTGIAVPSAAGTVTITGGGITSSGTPGGVTAPDGGGSPAAGAANTISPTVTTLTDATGTVRQIIGSQVDGTYTSNDVNGGTPGTPDAPSVTGTLNGLFISWDGKLGGAAPLLDFLWCEVYLSAVSGFTPSSATLTGTMQAAGTFPVTGLTVGTTYYVKLVARNSSGNASGASTQVSAVPTSLTATLAGTGLGTLNANPYFLGGDGSGWAGVSGSFSVSSTPPGTPPLKWAGFFTVTTAGVGAAAKESGAPFAASAGVQYLLTAWVYSSDTSAVIGFDWQNSSHTLLSSGTQTFTVTASTWTLVTGVFTSPSSTAYAVPRIAPGDVATHTIYFTEAIALPQVPGSLIQAGTITATQIAAATITASQIAASTITASQIAASTITASQIAASTITSAQIAAGTITASNIQSGTITAGLLAAGIVVANIVNGTTITGASIVADGTSGEILVYSGTPATGNLIGSWSGGGGTDASGNAYSAGLQVQTGGLILSNQGSAPGAVSGAGLLYCGGNGRPFFVDATGKSSSLERSVVNVAAFTVGNTTTPTAASAYMTYGANEGTQSSEYEIEIDGSFTTGTTTEPVNFQLYIDGSASGPHATIGGTGLTVSSTYFYTIRCRLAVLSSSAAVMAIDGNVSKSASANSQGAGNIPINFPIAAQNPSTSFDYTTAHTFQIYAWFSTAFSGQGMTTQRTRLTRRN